MTIEARERRLFHWRQKAMLGVSLLLVIALIPILLPVPINFARGWLASTASDALGLEVLISGPMRLQLGLHPELSVADVVFSGAEGEALASLQHASVKVSLTHILRGEIWLDRLEVASASIEACAWIIGEDDATDPEPAIIPSLVVEQLLTNDIEVTCAGDEGKPTWQAWIDHAQGTLSPDGDGSLLLSGTLAGNEIDFGLTAGSVVQFINGLRPLELQFEGRFGTTSVVGKGKATDVDDLVAELALSVEDENPLNLLGTFGVSGSALGPLVASGMVTLTSNGMGISGLQLALGNSLSSGGIDMDWAAAALRVDVDLQVAALEVTPLLSLDVKSDPNSNDESDSEPEVYFSVSVGRVIEYPWIEQAAASGNYVSDIIELATFEVNAYESRAVGRLQVDLQAKCPQLSFELDAESIPLELLAADWLPEEPIKGVVGSAAMTLNTRGCDIEALGNNLAATLRLAETTVSYDGDSSTMTDATLLVSHQPGPGLQLEASGVVMGLPLQATARADALSAWLEKSELAYQVQLEAAESRVSAQGQLQQVVDSITTNGSIVLNSDRIGALSHWLGTNAQSRLQLRGDSGYTVTTEEIVLSGITATMGKSDVQGSARWKLADDQLELELRSKVLVPKELLDSIADVEPTASQEEAFDLDRVLMPLTLDSPSITLIYSADQLESTPLAVSDLQLAATIEGGFLPELSFSLEVEDVPVSGRLSIMAPGGDTEIDLQLSASRIDSRKTVEKLQLAVPFRVTADVASVDVSSRGASLRQMLAKSTISFEASAVSVGLPGDGLEARPDLYLDIIRARSENEEPVTLAAQGSYDGEVVRLAVQGDSLLDSIAPNQKLTYEGNIHFAGEDADFHAALAPPIRSDLDIELSVSGTGLTLYETEGNLALALADPYHIEGRVVVAEDVVNVNDIRAKVGSSSFTGSLAWGRTEARNVISGRLESETIEFSDFLVPLPGNVEVAGPGSAVETIVSESAEQEVLIDEISTSLEQIEQAMNDYDIDFNLKAAEVRSNGVSLGAEELGVVLNDDRFSIRLDKLNPDEGDLSFEFSTQNLGSERQVTLRTQIERLNYAALSRSLAATDDSQGWVYADIELQTRAPSTEGLLQNVSGHFDVAVWPQGVYSPLFDIWVSSAIEVVLSATGDLLSSTEETDERGSALNCIVARFDVEKGVMKPEVIMLDSSSNNVLGDGYISLADQDFDLVFSPRAKTETLFSVATPIRISGRWNDFYVDPDYVSVPLTLPRWYLSLIYVPLQDLFGEPLPEDELAACRKAMRRAR